MRWRRAMRKGGKWAGLVACAVFIAAMIASPWPAPYWSSPKIGVGVYFRLGAVNIDLPPTPLMPAGVGFDLKWDSEGLGRWRWWPRIGKWSMSPSPGRMVSGLTLTLPLWIPLLLAWVPTGLLWRADRRAARRERAGQCGGCGYDRAGLSPTAPCPECGRAPASA